MDLNHVLAWTIGASSLLAILQVRSLRRGWKRIAAPMLVLITLGLTQWLLPEISGYVAAGVWCYLVLVPAVGNAVVSILLVRKWYVAARGVAVLFAVLQPFTENRRLPVLIRAMELLQRGQPDQAMPLLQRLADKNGELGRSALILQVRQTGNWQHLLDWFAAQPPGTLPLTEPVLLDGYLQALGETGRTAIMLREYDRICGPLAANLHGTSLNLIRAKIAAFCGDPAAVTDLFAGPLQSIPRDLQRYWQATAQQAQGRVEEAEQIFRELAALPGSTVRRPSLRRIDHPVRPFDPQEAGVTEELILSQLNSTAHQEFSPNTYRTLWGHRAWVTWTIAVSLVIVFLFEIPGGCERISNLTAMGALVVPTEITPGEYWRVFAAAFLHFGPVHLILNVLALLFLGSWLERLWGSWLTLLSYLLSAFGSIGLAPFFMRDVSYWNPAILLGASGGVMGLIGGLIVQTAFNWWNIRSAFVAREFQLLATVIILQIIFDQNSPNISSQAHLLGLAIGSSCGVVWNLIWWALRRRSQPDQES